MQDSLVALMPAVLMETRLGIRHVGRHALSLCTDVRLCGPKGSAKTACAGMHALDRTLKISAIAELDEPSACVEI